MTIMSGGCNKKTAFWYNTILTIYYHATIHIY